MFTYTKKLRFILLGVYFKKRVEPPISQERPWMYFRLWSLCFRLWSLICFTLLSDYK